MNQPPPSHPFLHPYYYYTQGVNGSTEDHTTIDLTTCQPSNKVEIIPNFLSVLNSSLDDGSDEREKKKSKLMKVCVDHTRSTLKKHSTNVNLTNDSSGSSTASNAPESDSEEWKKMPADVSKKSSIDMKSAGFSSTNNDEAGTDYSSGSESLL